MIEFSTSSGSALVMLARSNYITDLWVVAEVFGRSVVRSLTFSCDGDDDAADVVG